MKKIFFSLLFSVTILSLFSCKNFLNINNGPNETGISITLPFSNNRAAYTKDDITKYTVTITCTTDESISLTQTATPSNPTVTFYDIEPATYSVTVIGYNNETEIAKGSSTVTAVEGQTSTVTIKLTLLKEKSSNIDISISFDNNLANSQHNTTSNTVPANQTYYLPDYDDLFAVSHDKNDMGNSYRFCGWAAAEVQDITDSNYDSYITDLKNIQIIHPGESFTPTENTILYALWFTTNSNWDKIITVHLIHDNKQSENYYITDLIKTEDMGDNYKIQFALPEYDFFYTNNIPVESKINGLHISFYDDFSQKNDSYTFGDTAELTVTDDETDIYCAPNVKIPLLKYIDEYGKSYIEYLQYPIIDIDVEDISIVPISELLDLTVTPGKEFAGWLSSTNEFYEAFYTINISRLLSKMNTLPFTLKPQWKSTGGATPTGYTPITSLSEIKDKYGKYALTQDISVDSSTFTSPVLEAFYGVLDGQGHTIKFVNGSGELGTANYPLFGNIHKTAIVKDLRLIADAYTDYAGKADFSPIAWSTYGYVLGVEVRGTIQNTRYNRYAFGGYWDDGDSPYGTAYGCVLNAPGSELDALIAEDSNSSNLIALASDVVINGTTNSAWNSEKITESNNQVESWISINKSSNSDLEFFMRYVWDNSTSSITLVYKKN